jgi:pimeloyl-ACP methyl ester carboxylesterase
MELQDLRNHGDSGHNPHQDYISMADDVAGFIEEHKLKDTTLIGHSMSVFLRIQNKISN